MASIGPATTVALVIGEVVYVSAPGPAWRLRSSVVQGEGGSCAASSASAVGPAPHCSLWRSQALVAPTNATGSAPVFAAGRLTASVPSLVDGAPVPDGPLFR